MRRDLFLVDGTIVTSVFFNTASGSGSDIPRQPSTGDCATVVSRDSAGDEGNDEFSKSPASMMPFIIGGIMAYRTTHYPLGKLLLECLRNSQMSIQPFVQAIGYRNATKGVRAFDSILAYGYPNEVFLERLCSSSLAPDAQLLKEAIDQTWSILADEEREAEKARKEAEREAFRPFFQAVPIEKSPRQIFLFAVTGGHSRYTHYLLGSFPEWPLADQYRYLETKVPEAFAASDGRTLFMGKIIAYRLFRRYEEPALLLSVNGKPLGTEATTPLPDATVEIGGRMLSSEQATRLFQSDGGER